MAERKIVVLSSGRREQGDLKKTDIALANRMGEMLRSWKAAHAQVLYANRARAMESAREIASYIAEQYYLKDGATRWVGRESEASEALQQELFEGCDLVILIMEEPDVEAAYRRFALSAAYEYVGEGPFLPVSYMQGYVFDTVASTIRFMSLPGL